MLQAAFIVLLSYHCSIQPEGVPQQYSTAVFINLSPGQTYNSILNLSLPVNGLVSGSEYIEVTATGQYQIAMNECMLPVSYGSHVHIFIDKLFLGKSTNTKNPSIIQIPFQKHLSGTYLDMIH